MRKSISIITIILFVLLLVICSKESSASNEETNEDIIHENKKAIISIEQLNYSIQQQFNEIDNFTINIYLSKSSNSYTNNDLYISVSDGNGITHTYVNDYIETYTINDTIYYYDNIQKTWFKDTNNYNYNIPIAEEINLIKNQTFPIDTIVEYKELNGKLYIAATFIDTDADNNKIEVTYYFNDNIELIAACSEIYDNKNTSTYNKQYLYMTIILDSTEIPKNIKNSENGNYEEYITTLFYNNENIN